jgi:uroporphyrinogen-III synthase
VVAGALAAIGVAVALAALAALTAPQWSAWLADRSPDTGPLEARITALERASERAAAAAKARADRLAALEDRVEQLPNGAAELADSVRALVAARQATDRRLDALDAILEIVETRLIDLGARVEVAEAAAVRGPDAARRTEQSLAALDGRLGALERSREAFGFESRLAALEQRAAAIAAAPDMAALVVAVAQLRAVLAGSGRFGAELAGVRAILGEDPESRPHLAALAARAETGVPTLTVLESRFGGVAAAAARAARGPEGEGWVASSIRRLQALVSWRRTGKDAEAAGGVEMRLARAEAALAKADLAGAVQALDGLDGAAARAAGGWLADARARLQADRAVAALTVRAIAALKDGG